MQRFRTAALLVLGCTLAGCSGNRTGPQDDIIGVTWTLIEVNRAPVDPAQMNRPATLILDEEGRASGSAGCNGFGGPYTIDDDQLRFGAIAMTRMACPDRMEVENAYSTVFEATRSWRVTDGVLELIADGRVLARFRRGTSPASSGE